MYICTSSSEPHTLYDAFVGAGSILIAAELTLRQARLIELDPAYCDVTVKRWEEFTGKKATLASNGQSFEELSNTR